MNSTALARSSSLALLGQTLLYRVVSAVYSRSGEIDFEATILYSEQREAFRTKDLGNGLDSNACQD